MAEVTLEELLAYSLGNRTAPSNAAHQRFRSGCLTTNLCDFPPNAGREDLPLLPRPSMHQQIGIVLTILRGDLFPTCPLTQKSH